MKNLKFILCVAATVVMGLSVNVHAQKKGKYGADSAECIKYLSYYQEYYKQKNYDAALPNWRMAYKICPATASQNMLIHGTSLIARQITKNNNNPTYKSELVDTLLTLQDVRLQYYPSKAVSILNNKGQYIINYRSNDNSFVYSELNKIIERTGYETKESLLVFDLQAAIALFQEGSLTAEEVIETYNKVADIADNLVAKTDKEKEDKAGVQATLQSHFASSRIASCENLIDIFTPRYEADPKNVTLAATIAQLLSTADDCIDNDLYLNVVTTMHTENPSANSAYYLYKLLSLRGETNQAVSYLEEAIAQEDSDEAKDAELYYELATYSLKNGLRAKAYESARKSAELGYGFTGKAYFLIGTIWGSSACGDSYISKRAPYWVAVDYMQKAKAADPELAEEANRYISNYSAYYPEASEAFMYDITAGQSYTVSCGGMTATTTVRTSK